MKAILEFNLPEDNEDFNIAIDGVKWSWAMWRIDQHLRNQLKYESEGISEDTFKAIEKCREKLHEILNEEGLKL
jgi:hypothetical protein